MNRNDTLYAALALVAPGTPLREGIDRILQSNMGALIVIGDGPDVLSICSGGFLLDAGFTPQRLSELAKMDGAIILAADGSRIARANVHLVPDSSIPTSETGTRHRTAERVARQIARPVVTVSEEMSMVSIHFQGRKKTLEPIPRVLARSDQALQILGRYKGRLDQVSSNLSALEVEDLVTARDVAEMMQRAEMVRRIAAEIRGYVVELGTDGRLVALQLEELTSGVIDDLRYVCNDYFVESSDWELDAVLAGLAGLDDDDVVDLRAVLRVLHLPSDTELDSSVSPRGHRLLAKIPRLPDTVAGKIVEQFGSLTKLMRASIADLVEVEGVGEVRARAIKDGLSRLAETSILDRYS
jgi:diadenylate cyclase